MAESSGGGNGGTAILVILGIILFLGLFNRFGGEGGSYTPPRDTAGIQSEITRIGYDINTIKSDQALSKKIGNTSSLFGHIALNPTNVGSTNANSEYLTIDFDRSISGRTLLTGMEIKSQITGKGVILGKGVYLPELATANFEEPIFVKPGDRVYIISGHSPLGYSFRANKCTGFFGQSHNFVPSLYMNCPTPREDGYPTTGATWKNSCYNYIDSIPACTIPSEIPEDLGPDCTTYVTTKISYNECVKNHKNDLDFYSNEWYVYLNRDEDIWDQEREFLKLVDQNKLTTSYTEY